MKKLALIFFASLTLAGCATGFPTPSSSPISGENQLTGTSLFTKTFNAHGGEHLGELRNVNVGLEGKWKQLIRRIQPLVSDFTYRVKSQERLFPIEGVYAVNYFGPGGKKTVLRTPNEIKVWYNGEQSNSPEVLSSTALTGDSFHLFLLGPLALEKWRGDFQRLSDAKLNNKTYHRLYLERIPGFGFSKRDEVVLWVDPVSHLTKMVQITLEGHATTIGAHVEVEYLDYTRLENYMFPSKFFERVNAPIAIDAHGWQLTGLDINRDYDLQEIDGEQFTGEAAAAAKALQN
jgi:hypothetical protein